MLCPLHLYKIKYPRKFSKFHRRLNFCMFLFFLPSKSFLCNSTTDKTPKKYGKVNSNQFGIRLLASTNKIQLQWWYSCGDDLFFELSTPAIFFSYLPQLFITPKTTLFNAPTTLFSRQQQLLQQYCCWPQLSADNRRGGRVGGGEDVLLLLLLIFREAGIGKGWIN